MGSPPQVAKNGPFPNQIWLHFAIFGLLGFHFFSFWRFGHSFPFILAFWGFISFHFGLLGLHFLLLGPQFLSFWGCHVGSLPPTSCHLNKFYQRRSWLHFAIFGLSGLHFFSFRRFGHSFPFILAFWGFISFNFGLLGLLGLHFLSFWAFGLSFAFILAFWAFIFFPFGLLGLHFL